MEELHTVHTLRSTGRQPYDCWHKMGFVFWPFDGASLLKETYDTIYDMYEGKFHPGNYPDVYTSLIGELEYKFKNILQQSSPDELGGRQFFKAKCLYNIGKIIMNLIMDIKNNP